MALSGWEETGNVFPRLEKVQFFITVAMETSTGTVSTCLSVLMPDVQWLLLRWLLQITSGCQGNLQAFHLLPSSFLSEELCWLSIAERAWLLENRTKLWALSEQTEQQTLFTNPITSPSGVSGRTSCNDNSLQYTSGKGRAQNVALIVLL